MTWPYLIELLDVYGRICVTLTNLIAGMAAAEHLCLSLLNDTNRLSLH